MGCLGLGAGLMHMMRLVGDTDLGVTWVTCALLCFWNKRDHPQSCLNAFATPYHWLAAVMDFARNVIHHDLAACVAHFYHRH